MELANAGCYLASPDIIKAVKKLEEWRNNSNITQQIGNHARAYVTQHFARKPILDSWVKKLSELVSG